MFIMTRIYVGSCNRCGFRVTALTKDDVGHVCPGSMKKSILRVIPVAPTPTAAA